MPDAKTRERMAKAGNEDDHPKGSTALVKMADGRPGGMYHLRAGSILLPPKAKGDDANEADPRAPFRVREDLARELMAEGICEPADEAAAAMAADVEDADKAPAELTTKVLRDELRAAGMKVVGDKDELVARVERLRAGESTEDDRSPQ